MLLLRRPIIPMRLLRHARRRSHCADPQRQHPSAELGSQSHAHLHLLILLLHLVRLHRLRQFR